MISEGPTSNPRSTFLTKSSKARWRINSWASETNFLGRLENDKENPMCLGISKYVVSLSPTSQFWRLCVWRLWAVEQASMDSKPVDEVVLLKPYSSELKLVPKTTKGIQRKSSLLGDGQLSCFGWQDLRVTPLPHVFQDITACTADSRLSRKANKWWGLCFCLTSPGLLDGITKSGKDSKKTHLSPQLMFLKNNASRRIYRNLSSMFLTSPCSHRKMTNPGSWANPMKFKLSKGLKPACGKHLARANCFRWVRRTNQSPLTNLYKQKFFDSHQSLAAFLRKALRWIPEASVNKSSEVFSVH